MSNNKTPAPVDNKNILTDWLEMIFDDYNYTCGGKDDKYYTGFVDGCAVITQIHRNEIRWQISNAFWGADKMDDVYDTLLNRLKSCDANDDDNQGIECEYYKTLRHDGYLVQIFYFKNDD